MTTFIKPLISPRPSRLEIESVFPQLVSVLWIRIGQALTTWEEMVWCMEQQRRHLELRHLFLIFFFFFTTKFSHRPHDLNLRLSHSLEWLLNFPGGIFHMLGRWCWCRWCSPQRWSSPLKLRKMYIRETILCFLCSLESLHQDSWLRVLTKEIHYECS